VDEAFAVVCRRVVPDSPFTLQPGRSALDRYQALFTFTVAYATVAVVAVRTGSRDDV